MTSDSQSSISSNEFWRQKFIHDYGEIDWKESCLSAEVEKKLESMIKTDHDDTPDIELALQLGSLNRVFVGFKTLSIPIEQAAVLTGYVNSKYKTADGLIDVLNYLKLRGLDDNYRNGKALILEEDAIGYWLVNIKSDDDVLTILEYFRDNMWFYADDLSGISKDRYRKIKHMVETFDISDDEN